MKQKVFLSYARNDKDFAFAAFEYLQKRKILSRHENVLVDFPELEPGSTGGSAFRKAIESADTFVLIWSEAAMRSNFVNYEIGMADALGKNIIVAIRRGEKLPLPGDLQRIAYIEVPDA